jgi:hypothetical protein
MEPDFVDKTYDRIDFKESLLVKGDYEAGKFTNCDLMNSSFENCKVTKARFEIQYLKSRPLHLI